MAEPASDEMMGLQPAPEETQDTSLGRRRLGVVGIVFFVVAAAAPLVGMTGAVPVAIVLGNGAAVPGAYVAVGLTLVVFSVGYAAMSHQVTNTGAFFAYVGRGLGIGPGVGSAFVSLFAYLSIQLAIFGFFGAVLAAEMTARVGLDLPWWVWVLIAWGIVLALSLLSVDIGAKVLGLLMILELLSLALTAVAVFGRGGAREGVDFGAAFWPGNIFAGGFAGSAGIALAFAFASFIGFEATAIYGEEARDPKRSVPRATYLSVGLISGIFALTSWAIVSGLGTSVVVDRVAELSSVEGVPLTDPAAVLYAVAGEYVGPWLSTTMSWLVISSLFAGLLAFQNCAARYFFAMGRAGVLPTGLDRVNQRNAPGIAAMATSAVTLVVILLFVILDRDPVLNLFYWGSGMAVIAIVLTEILVSVAILAYFRRERSDTRTWNTIIAPVLAALGLTAGLYLLMSRFALLAGTAAEGSDPSITAWALSPTGWVLVLLPFATFVVGLGVGLARQRRENVDAVADLVS
jgi:amino acid transporter